MAFPGGTVGSKIKNNKAHLHCFSDSQLCLLQDTEKIAVIFLNLFVQHTPTAISDLVKKSKKKEITFTCTYLLTEFKVHTVSYGPSYQGSVTYNL